MGGTCDPRTGGHNLYEPAALGKVIVGGPHYNNFPDIGRELEAHGAYRRVGGSGEWQEFLGVFADLDLEKIGNTAREAVAGRKGSLQCSLEQIQKYLA
jgi:3-deoxy-D-manno-octulosonic-acid transferase